MGRRKQLPKTGREARAHKVVTEMHKRDIDPADTRSNTRIIQQAGFSPNTKPIEVLNSKLFLKEYELYYKHRKTPVQIQEQLAAKARRNMFEGMDDEDKKVKLEYTRLQLNQEDKEASRMKLEMKDSHGNMMTLLGASAQDALQSGAMGMVTEITSEEVALDEGHNG